MKSIKILSVAILFCGITIPLILNAETVLWSESFNRIYFIDRIGTLENPNIQIAYGARAYNLDTGQVIPCGSKVIEGTNLLFQFYAQSYTDISWFGTGHTFDSPYGEWVAGAGVGSGSVCSSKNDYLSGGLFANFAVQPPNRSISGLDTTQCTPYGIDYICNTNKKGTLFANFNFAATYGQFWSGVLMRNTCYTSQNPLSYAYSSIINVPAKTIACNIIVEPKPIPKPLPPVINGADCVVGRDVTYSITGTHPKPTLPTSKLSYQIDWFADGTVDQHVPSVGYVEPGATVQVKHSWNTNSPGKFNVRSIDMLLSPSDWTTYYATTCSVYDPVTKTYSISTTEKIPGSVGVNGGPVNPVPIVPPSVIDFNLNPKITNTTCKATWSAENVSNCAFYMQGKKYLDVELSGEKEMLPGTYEFRCTRDVDGKNISMSRSCVKNPNMREI